MRKEELFDAIGGIDEKEVERAQKSVTFRTRKRNVWLRRGALIACAALVCGVMIGGPMLKKRNRRTGEEEYAMGVRAVMAAYPDPVAPDMNAAEFCESDAHGKWWRSCADTVEKSSQLQTGMDDYYTMIMAHMLAAEDDNTVCSPLNTYLAFAMLAEVSDGQSRQQILDMLGAQDMQTLRENAGILWECNYVDTPTLKSVLANSLWLSDGVKYNEDTLERLAKEYYASSFRGTPGSPEMDEALRNWTDANTGDLLKEYTQNMTIDKRTVLEIMSTIFYKATWTDEFREEETAQEIFHGTRGDSDAEMMHRTDFRDVYRTQNFTALGLNLKDSGGMYFYLPAEGTDVNALLSDPDLLKATRYDETDENRITAIVHLSVPKFTVSAKTDLTDTIREMGVTDILDWERADFTPLTKDTDEMFLSKAEHAAMVQIDEQGVTGAAYTELAIEANGALIPEDEIDFVLDRPFLFLIVGRDGSVLFSGIVRNID